MPLTNPSATAPTAVGPVAIPTLTITTDPVTGKQSAMVALCNTLVDGTGKVLATKDRTMVNIPDLAAAAVAVPAIAPLVAQVEPLILQIVALYAAAKKTPGFDKIQFSQ